MLKIQRVVTVSTAYASLMCMYCEALLWLITWATSPVTVISVASACVSDRIHFLLKTV